MFRHVGLVVIPGLCAFHENIGIGLKPAWIVQSTNAKPNEVRAGPDLHIQWGAAITAEYANDVVAAIGFRYIAFWCALADTEACARHASGRDMCSTAVALAVAAMTTQGEDGRSHGFIADCAAEAAACSGIGHGWSPAWRNVMDRELSPFGSIKVDDDRSLALEQPLGEGGLAGRPLALWELPNFASSVGSLAAGTAGQEGKAVPPCASGPKHPRNMLFGRTIIPGERSRQDTCDIGHPCVMGQAPLQQSVRPDCDLEPRLNLDPVMVGQREECLSSEAGAAEEHAHLRKRESGSVQGDPHGIPNESEPTVPVTPSAMCRQTARADSPHQQSTPERAVLR